MYVALQNDAHLESKEYTQITNGNSRRSWLSYFDKPQKTSSFFPLCFFLGEEFFFLFFTALPKKGALIIYLFALQGPQSLQCARESLARYLN